MASNEINTKSAESLAAEKQAKFDKLPIAVQMLIGLAALLAIAIVGFAAVYAIDFLLLDFDPIGKLFSAIF